MQNPVWSVFFMHDLNREMQGLEYQNIHVKNRTLSTYTEFFKNLTFLTR